MHSALLWWRSRLNERQVFYGRAVKDVHYRGQWPWPQWASRAALYQDYVWWFANEYAKPAYLARVLVPDPADVEEFLTVLKPYIYGTERTATATSFPVLVSEHYKGRWLRVAKRYKFVRMPTLLEAEQQWQCARAKALTINR